MNLGPHLKEYMMIYTAVGAALALLGGSIAITLPADLKITELETRFTQTWQQQQQYHAAQELDQVRWKMRAVTAEINRIRQIPQYLNRSANGQELWQIEQLQLEWKMLREREMQLVSALGGAG